MDDEIGTSDPGALGRTGGDGTCKPGVLSSRERFEKDEAISFLIRLRVWVRLVLRSASENCGEASEEGMGADGGWLDVGKYCWNVCFWILSSMILSLSDRTTFSWFLSFNLVSSSVILVCATLTCIFRNSISIASAELGMAGVLPRLGMLDLLVVEGAAFDVEEGGVVETNGGGIPT